MLLGTVMNTLREIASHQRQGLPMTDAPLDFINPAVSTSIPSPRTSRATWSGKVLHAATGFPRLLEVTIDGVAYRGFVSSDSEVVTEDFERLDDDWVGTQARESKLKPMPWLGDIAPPG